MREPGFPYLKDESVAPGTVAPEKSVADAAAAAEPEIALDSPLQAVDATPQGEAAEIVAQEPKNEATGGGDAFAEPVFGNAEAQLELEFTAPPATVEFLEDTSEPEAWDDEGDFVVMPEIGDMAEAALSPHEFLQAIEAEGVKRRPLDLWQRLALLFGLIGGTLYDLQMRHRGVRLIRQKVQLAGIPRQSPTLKIGFISDLHYGPTSGRVAARQAWKQLHEARPDVLLLGGDYLYADHRGLPTLLREIQRWKWDRPKAGIYAVLGNHDYDSDTVAIVMALQACGVQVLCNESVQLPEPWNSVWIAGIDDIRYGKPDIEKTLQDIPRSACTIMLSHSPDVCQYEELKRCRLTLCGDTHGGQVCMPSGEPVYMAKEWGKNFPAGMYRHAGNWIFVSRGVGTVRVPLRMFAPPDVALFEIAGAGGGNTL